MISYCLSLAAQTQFPHKMPAKRSIGGKSELSEAKVSSCFKA